MAMAHFTALDENTKDVMNMLGTVEAAPILEEVAATLTIPGEQIEAVKGSLRGLYRLIANFINSDAFDALEDGGLGFLMAVRDKLRQALNIVEPDPGDTDEDEENDVNRDLKPDVPLFPPGPDPINVGALGAAALGRLRELKLNGTIGKPGQKGKLTYSSLISQIKNAVRRGFDDGEICAAVVKCIDPNTALRNYLEEIDDLTVNKLTPILQSHFQEKNATALYHQMNNAVMSGEDTELSFCMDLMALRDKIFKISTAQGGEYTKPLLQTQFQKALYTGIKNERVRQELKPLLNSRRRKTPTDEQIMTEITEICMLDMEHQLKVETKPTKRGNVASATAVETEKESHTEKTKPKPGRVAKSKEVKSEDMVNQLNSMLSPLTTQVCELFGAVKQLNQQANQSYQPNQPMQPQNQMQLSQHQGQPTQQQAQPQLDPSAPAFGGAYAAGYGYEDPNMASGRRGRGAYWGWRGGRPAHWPTWFRGSFADNSGGGSGRGGFGGSNARGSGRGSFNGGRGGYNGHGNVPQYRNPPFKCPTCLAANAVYCNHCRVCYAIEHRTGECPKKDDPTFTPDPNPKNC